MIRYAITDGTSSTDDLLKHARQWAAEDVNFVQLREKHRPAGDLVLRARAMAKIFREAGAKTKLLVNGRPDIAVAARADGVHLTAHPDEMTSDQVRRVFAAAGLAAPVISVSCHSLADVLKARESKPNLILFGPVFEKRVGGELVAQGVGLEALHEACGASGGLPVLALGGVTAENRETCVEAGAAGVAGIRLFG